MTVERSREFWDEQAATYDRRSAWLEERFLRRGRVWACSRAVGDTLEIGVGTGANLPHYPAGVRLVAIDHAPRMVAEARGRAQELGMAATIAEGDAGHLVYADASFDTVVATYVLCCVPDDGLALREAVRVLRPGGRLLLADHVVSTSAPVRWGQRALERATARYGERFTRRPAALLEGLGLEVVERRRSTLGALEQVRAVRP